MSELLLIVIIVQLGFVLSRLPRKSKPSEEVFAEQWERERKENAALVASQLRGLRLCPCLFTFWLPASIFSDAGSASMEGRGVVIDSDDEWVLIECPAPLGAKGAVQRLFRIEDIKSVAEIVR